VLTNFKYLITHARTAQKQIASGTIPNDGVGLKQLSYKIIVRLRTNCSTSFN